MGRAPAGSGGLGRCPPLAHWQQAVALLQWLDLLDGDGAITDHGKAARQLGTHPRLAHMVLRGRALGLAGPAAELAALLEERDLLGPGRGADLHERLRVLRGEQAPVGVDPARLKAVRQAARRLSPEAGQGELPGEAEVGRLLALAYPDRIARRRPGPAPRYQLSNGRGAALREDDPLARHDWLVAADLDGQAREAAIYLAAPVDRAVAGGRLYLKRLTRVGDGFTDDALFAADLVRFRRRFATLYLDSA